MAASTRAKPYSVTHRLKMSEDKTGFDLMKEGKESIKILLIPE